MIVALLALLATGRPAAGTPYEVMYDANTDGVFPEDEGWERWTTGGGVGRTVQDGILTLAAIKPEPNGGSDQYRWDAMEALNPDSGEMFFAEWRMRLLPDSSGSDVGVFIATDAMQRHFHMIYEVNAVGNTGDNTVAFLDTTIFRTYRLESLDMLDYAFYIDGQFAWQGFFRGGTTRSSEVRFGDQLVGSASASHWDYFKFGVVSVPEPSTCCLVFCGCFLLRRRRRRGTRPFNMEDRPCPE